MRETAIAIHITGSYVVKCFPEKYGVNLALWGHNHSYQRTCPVYNETCTTDGVTHVVIGMGGAHLSDGIMPCSESKVD